jgi:hypothetical protein
MFTQYLHPQPQLCRDVAALETKGEQRTKGVEVHISASGLLTWVPVFTDILDHFGP